MGLGIDRRGGVVNGYYAVGFSDRTVEVKHFPANYLLCEQAEEGRGNSWFDASKYVSRTTQCISASVNSCGGRGANNTLAAITDKSFIMQASGNISRKSRMDKWTIDHNKNLRHVSVGY